MPLNCEIANGFMLLCKDHIGGIKELVIGPWSGNEVITLNNQEVVTDYSANAGDYFRFILPKHTGNFEETGNFDIAQGTAGFYTQTINATFHKLTALRRQNLQEMTKLRMVIFVKDNNDNYWLCGHESGMEVTAMTTTTGTTKTDNYGYTITFTGEESKKAYLVSDFSLLHIPLGVDPDA